MRSVRLVITALLFLLLFLFLCRSLAHSADRRADPRTISIATFNARFLFDGVSPEGEAGFPWKSDPSAARRHLREIAAILRAVDADIVHVSEVENIETLKRLVLEMDDPTYKAFLVPGRDDFTRQNVGIITRIDPDAPLLRTDEWASGPRGGPPQGVAKNYAARITAGALALTLVGAHLLAFPDDPERAVRREAQAVVLRGLEEEEGTRRGRLVVLLGDLNDLDPEVPDAAGHTSQSLVLGILRDVAPDDPADDLVNPVSLLPQEERFTAFADKNQNGADDGLDERSLTDHVLVPRVLEPAIARVEVFHQHDPLGPSDHFPLKVTLDLTAARVFLRGDANRDGRVNERDAVSLLLHLFGGRATSCLDAADVDDDGRVRITDPVYLLTRIHRNGPPPPPPGPKLPGEDETADDLGCDR